MAPAAPSYVYADRASVERLLSEAGVRLRLDHDGDGQANAADEAETLNECLYAATATIDHYLYSKYAPANLVNSWWVWRRGTVLAAYELDRLRNNPASETLTDWAEKTLEELRAVAAGTTVLAGVPMRMTQAPTWSNVRIVQAYQFRTIRVERTRSSPSALPQAPDYASEASEP